MSAEWQILPIPAGRYVLRYSGFVFRHEEDAKQWQATLAGKTVTQAKDIRMGYLARGYVRNQIWPAFLLTRTAPPPLPPLEGYGEYGL